ncbi:MAG: dephospho-CoA kinase [Saprospiraceae bacterium]
MSKVCQSHAGETAALKIGITGGIGSGKTTICKIFETLSIPVYYADERAKFLMANDVALKAKIKSLLGEAAYVDGKTLNRDFIAGIVFSDARKLEALNTLVHPAVGEDYAQWHAAQSQVPYTLKEAALLFESNGAKMLDKTIVVHAPVQLRIERVMARDGVSETAVRNRMDKQMDDGQKRKLADFVILNDGEHPLIPQVVRLHEQLLQIAQHKSGERP